jgi:hypothetical protein
MPKTIVSITPVALDRDSRSLKIASSFAKWGYKSIVVEGQPSSMDFSRYGIEVISLGGKIVDSVEQALHVKQSRLNQHLKWIWHQFKKINFTFLLNYVSFYFFKRDFYSLYVNDVHKVLPEADIYYLHSYEYFLAIKEKIKNTRAKIIYDAHDFYIKINPDKPFLGDSLVKAFQRHIEKELITKADMMFTVSDGLKKLYIDEYKASPTVLRNTHCSKLDNSTDISLKKELGLDRNDYITVVIGNHKEGQALKAIISTFLKCVNANHYLVFIGGGYQSIQETLSANEQRKILFLSHVHPTMIVPLAREAHFGILPYFPLTNNYKYALPNGFFQMIAAELPIIFSKDLEEINTLNENYQFGVGTDFHSPEIFNRDFKYFLENFSEKNALNARNILTWENEESILKEKVSTLSSVK